MRKKKKYSKKNNAYFKFYLIIGRFQVHSYYSKTPHYEEIPTQIN